MRGLVRKVLLAPQVYYAWYRSAGWRAALDWSVFRVKAGLGFPPPANLQITPRRAKYPVLARLGRSSDLLVFEQIFAMEEYACLNDLPSPRFILDLGANVGYSSAYFLSRFPEARVLAVEPDPSNFELCCKNLARYGDRATVLLGAVWSSRSRLVLSPGTYADRREWATQVVADTGSGKAADVEGYDIPALLEVAGAESVDLLKIDIERSELELFGEGAEVWLPRVRNICIELHGEDCRAVFEKALRGFDYEAGSSGELTICRNLRRRAISARA